MIPTPTDRWLETTAGIMPPMDGPEGTAERLLLLLHYGIDWDNGWVGNYRPTYWDRILPDRIIVATYLSPNLRTWWDHVAADLVSRPGLLPSALSWPASWASPPCQCCEFCGSKPPPCCSAQGSSPRRCARGRRWQRSDLHHLVRNSHRTLIDQPRR